MIDIEPQVFDKVYRKITEAYPGIYVSSGYVAAAPSFPCMTLMEMSNIPVVSTQTSSESENHSTLMYEANVYTNGTVGRKASCRAIAQKLDEIMTELGFYRTMMTPVPNEDDSIYRITARYTGVVSKDEVIYRR